MARLGSLGIGIVILLLFVNFVGIEAVVEVLVRVSPEAIVIMVLIQLLGFTFYAAAWYLLIRAAGYNLPFITCQGITFASIFAIYTTPSGVFLEATRVILGSKETGMRLGESVATVILQRILYIIGFLGSTAIALLGLFHGGQLSLPATVELATLPLIAVAGLGILLYLSFNPMRLTPLLERLLKLAAPLMNLIEKEANMNGKAGEVLNDYHTSFRKMLSSKERLVFSFMASLGDWACSILILWVVLLALGVPTPLWVVLITMAIGKMIQMTPIAVPGMIGIYEAAISTSLLLFGVPLAAAVSAALLARIVTAWLDLPITGIAAYHYGYKLLAGRSLSFHSSKDS